MKVLVDILFMIFSVGFERSVDSCVANTERKNKQEKKCGI